MTYLLSYKIDPSLYDYVFIEEGFFTNTSNEPVYSFPSLKVLPSSCIKHEDKLLDNTTIFCQSEQFEQLVDILSVLKTQHTLIVDSGDKSIPNCFLPKNIRFVYSPNVNFESTKIKPFPRGSLVIPSAIKNSKKEWLYINFKTYTNPRFRIPLLQQLYIRSQHEPWIKITNPDRTDEQYFQELCAHKYVLCPFGNGLDSYRQWSSMYCGVIPVVQKCPMNDWFAQHLPMLVVNNIAGVSLVELMENYDRLSNMSNEACTVEWWNKKLHDYSPNS